MRSLSLHSVAQPPASGGSADWGHRADRPHCEAHRARRSSEVAAVVEEGDGELGGPVPVPLDSGLLHAGTTRPRVAATHASTAARNLHEGADFIRTLYQTLRGRSFTRRARR